MRERAGAERTQNSDNMKRTRHSPEQIVTKLHQAATELAGGKWTTYRAMGEAAVGTAARVGGLPSRACATHELPLRDARPQLDSLLSNEPSLREILHPRLPYCLGDVACAIRFEQARTVEDVLSRRTRALILDAAASIEAAPRVAALLARELGRDAAWECAQATAFTTLARGYLPS